MKKALHSVIPALAVLASAAAMVLPAAAGDGRIPLYQPTVIAQPGSYVVTRNISSSTGPIFDIQAHGVTLDLGGHTLSVSGVAAPALKISSLGGIDPEPFRLLNGSIIGGLHGLHAPMGINPCMRLSNLSFRGQAGTGIKLEGIKSLEATGIIVVETRVGIEISPPPADEMPMVRIREAQIRANGGIHCTNAVCSIRDSSLRIVPPADGTANTPAILFNGARGEAVGIIVVDTMPVGLSPVLDLRDSEGIIVVETNVGVIGAPGAGAGAPCLSADAMTKGLSIVGGSFTGCGGDGIVLMAWHSSISGSLISGNRRNGVFLDGSDNLVRDVRIASNGGAGIWFEAGRHIYMGNVLRGNGGPGGEMPLDGPALAEATDGGGNIP